MPPDVSKHPALPMFSGRKRSAPRRSATRWRDDVFGDPESDLVGVGGRQAENNVGKAGVDSGGDGVAGTGGIVVGDPHVGRAGDRGGVASELEAVTSSNALRAAASSTLTPAMFQMSAYSAATRSVRAERPAMRIGG
jgi:hypothetical protein